MGENILEMNNIHKEFPGVVALDNVSFSVRKGEIHALVGENGAGKSTLMKILSGLYPIGEYTGTINIDGKLSEFKNIKDSEAAGVAVIYQELTLVKEMDITENIFLGNENTKNGLIDWDTSADKARKILKEIRMNISPSTKIVNLGLGQQQLVEIAKAVAKRASILVLDEPTSSLTETESDNLLNLLREFKERGVTCIFISHKLKEVFNISDRITVLCDGRTVGTYETSEITEGKLISLMVGRELAQRYPEAVYSRGDVALEVRDWVVYDPELTYRKVIDNVSFKAYSGEILGIAGLMGAGRTELFMSILGAYGTKVSGTVMLGGKQITTRNTGEIINSGISYLTEDRKGNGLVLMQDVRCNLSLSSLDSFLSLGLIDENKEIAASEHMVSELRIKTPSIEQRVENLSGGNQQKVVLGKWLMTSPKVLILDEPTRGIDVGAKYEIYTLMLELVKKGICIIMISSELQEVLGMSDRILIVHEGKITGEVMRGEADQEKIITYATGGM